MKLPASKFFNYKNFVVSDKCIIKNLTIAYRTWGKLNQEKDNVVLICHGYTNHHHALDKDIGWFNNLMGAGKALDTDKYFVICSNMLGSSFGSTGPKSINEKTNKPYGSTFPKIKNLDIINAQKLLIESLKIKRLHAALGYSFGGHLVYLWATEFPDSICKVISIAGSLDRWDVTKEKIELIEKPCLLEYQYKESDKFDSIINLSNTPIINSKVRTITSEKGLGVSINMENLLKK